MLETVNRIVMDKIMNRPLPGNDMIQMIQGRDDLTASIEGFMGLMGWMHGGILLNTLTDQTTHVA